MINRGNYHVFARNESNHQSYWKTSPFPTLNNSVSSAFSSDKDVRAVATFARDISIEPFVPQTSKSSQLPAPCDHRSCISQVRVNPPIWHSFQTLIATWKTPARGTRGRLSAAAGTIKLKSHCAPLRRRSNQQRRSFIVLRNGPASAAACTRRRYQWTESTELSLYLRGLAF